MRDTWTPSLFPPHILAQVDAAMQAVDGVRRQPHNNAAGGGRGPPAGGIGALGGRPVYPASSAPAAYNQPPQAMYAPPAPQYPAYAPPFSQAPHPGFDPYAGAYPPHQQMPFGGGMPPPGNPDPLATLQWVGVWDDCIDNSPRDLLTIRSFQVEAELQSGQLDMQRHHELQQMAMELRSYLNLPPPGSAAGAAAGAYSGHHHQQQQQPMYPPQQQQPEYASYPVSSSHPAYSQAPPAAQPDQHALSLLQRLMASGIVKTGSSAGAAAGAAAAPPPAAVSMPAPAPAPIPADPRRRNPVPGASLRSDAPAFTPAPKSLPRATLASEDLKRLVCVCGGGGLSVSYF